MSWGSLQGWGCRWLWGSLTVQPHLGRGLGTRDEAERDKASREGVD